MRLLTATEISNGDETNGKEKKQQTHCGRASESRTRVVQDHPSTPFSIRTADADGHENIMPGAKPRFWRKPILFLRRAHETRFGVRWPKRKRHRTPHPSPVRCPEAGVAPRLRTYILYLGTRSPHMEYNMSI